MKELPPRPPANRWMANLKLTTKKRVMKHHEGFGDSADKIINRAFDALEAQG